MYFSMRDTCSSHFEAKNLTGFDGEGGGGVREGQNMAQNCPQIWLLSPPRDPQMGQGPLMWIPKSKLGCPSLT